MIKIRQKTKVICKDCGKELFVRNDYLKMHKGRCQRCAKLYNWYNDEYVKKCSESHKGKENLYRRLPTGEANFNGLYGSYKRSAQARGIEFQLSVETFRILTKGNCYYCGVEPNQKYDEKSNKWIITGYWIYNGVDRKNDDVGYTDDNCVSCCKICNYAKQGLSDIEFLEHIRKIYNNNLIK